MSRPALPEMCNSEAPPTRSEEIELLVGCGRASYGDAVLDGPEFPRSAMLHECCFSASVALLLSEAGEAYRCYRADLVDKPEWHKKVNAKMETPGLRLAQSQEWLDGTDNIIDTLVVKSALVGSLASARPPTMAGASKDGLDVLMAAFALSLAPAKPNGMRSFLLQTHGVDPDEGDVSKGVAALQGIVREGLGRWEEALSLSDYLCGDEPGLLDCRLVSKLWTVYNLTESGLAKLGSPFAEIAPLTFAYLERFSGRGSWEAVFGLGREVTPGGNLDVYILRTVCQKIYGLSPELLPVIQEALARSRRGEDEDVVRAMSRPALPEMCNSEAPPTRSEEIELLVGCGRASYGDAVLDGPEFPRSAMLPECSFSASVALLLSEAGEAYRCYRADLADKPEWHKKVNAKMETPGLRLAQSQEWLDGTDNIIDTLVVKSALVGSLASARPPTMAGASKDGLDVQMAAFALLMAPAKPNGMRSFLLQKHGVDPDEGDVSKGVAALQGIVREGLGRWEEALSLSDYLCGDEPGLLDCRLVSKLWTVYNLTESGLAKLGSPFAEIAPLTFAYLERFSGRGSWEAVFGLGREVTPGGNLDVYILRTVCQKIYGLSPELLPVIQEALARSRRGEDEDVVRAMSRPALPEMCNSEAPPTRSEEIELLVGCGRASYGDAVLDGPEFPRSAMLPECSFSASVALLLSEAGEAYRCYRADLADKPEWHKKVNAKMETPGLRLAQSQEWLDGTDSIIDTLVVKSALVGSLASARPPTMAGASKDGLDVQMAAFALLMAPAKPNGMRSFLLQKHGVDPDEGDVSKGVAALQGIVREGLGRWEEALSLSDYLCGDEPGLLDCRLVSKLWTVYNLTESGLAKLGSPFAEIAPLTFAYLERFSGRGSWEAVFGLGREVTPGGNLDVYILRTVCQKIYGLSPELLPVIQEALAKAREKSSRNHQNGAELPCGSSVDDDGLAKGSNWEIAKGIPPILSALQSQRGKKEKVRGLIKRAGSISTSRPATTSSRLLRFTPSTLYFLILEKSWWFCCLLAMIMYGLPIVVVALISIPLRFDNDTEEAEIFYNGDPPPQVIMAFRFAAANVISMGYGTVFPTSNVGYLIATLSQLSGILINVFVFAAVLAKFQSPKADVVFSDKICLFTRDGVRHLCLRVGNLRCHTLYNPSLRLFVLKEQETSEGEDFVKIVELPVALPGTISGFYNITHRIDEESPLFSLSPEDMKNPDNVMAFQVIVTALDPVYQAEVCAKCSYNSASQLELSKRFADMMVLRDGRSTIDFAKFDELQDVMRSPSSSSLYSQRSYSSRKAQTTLCL